MRITAATTPATRAIIERSSLPGPRFIFQIVAYVSRSEWARPPQPRSASRADANT
jgi:hypothetical protein